MINRVLLSFMSLACIVFVSCNAYAQAVPGCNPQVLDAMQKKAQAKVAADINVTEETIDKPDSVLAMTCFNKAAGVSAAKGGAIFSGDFTSGLAPIIEDALSAMYDDFADAAGFDSTTIDYSANTLTNDETCDNVKNLWDEIKTEGVQQGIPFMTVDQLINGIAGAAPGGAGTTFKANWDQEAADGVFSDLKAAVAALPLPSVPSFAGAVGSCAMLVAAGVLSGPCP